MNALSFLMSAKSCILTLIIETGFADLKLVFELLALRLKLSNTCEMLVASIVSSRPRDFQRPLKFKGKLTEHHAQSPFRKFLMLTVWP